MENNNGGNTLKSLGKILRFFLYFFIVCLLLFVFATGFFVFGLYQVYSPLGSGQSQKIEVEKGGGVKLIADDLKSQNLIRSDFWFEVYVWVTNKGDRLQAGQYMIGPDLNIAQIVELISGGKVIENDIWLTFPEGFTIAQTEERLINGGLGVVKGISQEKISNYLGSYQFFSGAPEGVNLQGFLFPDTYKFKKEASQDDILSKMLDNFDKKLTSQMREDIKKQNRSVFEIITMASILEKEVNGLSDRKIAAGIFWKRMNDNYPLESDATLSYIFDDKESRHTTEQTKIDSLYNTYRYIGLPPTPINNPGIESIEAAIYPEKTDYYFFLTKPDTGEAVFSRTLQEHILNKAKYLK